MMEHRKLWMTAAAVLLMGSKNSHGDRYLGMTAAMTQAPVPTAILKIHKKEGKLPQNSLPS